MPLATELQPNRAPLAAPPSLDLPGRSTDGVGIALWCPALVHARTAVAS